MIGKIVVVVAFFAMLAPGVYAQLKEGDVCHAPYYILNSGYPECTTDCPGGLYSKVDLTGYAWCHAETIQNELTNVCNYAGAEMAKCNECAGRSGVWTAIGCIPVTPSDLFKKVFDLGIGIAGGLAFLLILFGGFQILLSAGNPERLNAGKELITSAVAGLLLIIFSVFLLRLIGVDILGIFL